MFSLEAIVKRIISGFHCGSDLSASSCKTLVRVETISQGSQLSGIVGTGIGVRATGTSERCYTISSSLIRKLLVVVMYFLLQMQGLAALAYEEYAFRARVIAITDGDTIKVLRDKTEVTLRLHGIDCPESNQDFGAAAKKFASNFCFDKTVKVVVRGNDRYGRSIAEVFLEDGRSLNLELVSNGYAWWYRQYASKDFTLARLESDAREKKLGLWSQANPIPPWEFRKFSRTRKKTRRTRSPSQTQPTTESR